MPEDPNNPSEPKGPWLYSGASQPTPAYTSPPSPQPTPQNTASPKPAAKIITPVAKPAPAPQPQDNSLASIVDTIEAVIIALILALTFRAFIIEAFVIPTGSMAPTLLGAHFDVVCPKCGYTFTRDASLYYQQTSPGVISRLGLRAELTSNSIIPVDGRNAVKLVCPNCHYIIPYESLPQFLENRPIDSDARGSHPPGGLVPFAWANNGDRILVLKYIYALLNPQRYDVIVFKEPMQAQDNFIKRLIGLPEETIEVVGGDIFVGAPGHHAESDLNIARKPPWVQKYVWQNVYDNDYYPTDEGLPRAKENSMPDSFSAWHNPWTGQGPTAEDWNRKPRPGQTGPFLKTVGGPVIHYDAHAPGTLEFNHDRNDPYTYNILGYNDDITELYNPPREAPLLPVGDLRLETTWTPADSNAASPPWIALDVGADRNRFRVKWSHAGLEFLHYDASTKTYISVEKVPASEVPAPVAGHAYNVALNNVDHAVQFFIDGTMVKQHLTPWTAAQALVEAQRLQHDLDTGQGTVLEALGPHVDVTVGGACTLAHLKLLRDLYYTQTIQGTGRFPGAANEGLPLTLGKDEYFAMGDNSRESNDGRTWDTVFPALDDLGTRRGIVPGRYLLGKAVFVYWPAGFRFTDKLSWMPPLVPNVGNMRFIR